MITLAPPISPWLLQVQELEVCASGRAILRLPQLSVAAGQMTAILGANGAGKSTLLRCLAELYPPHKGQVTYASHFPTKPRLRATQRAYLAQHNPVSPGLSVADVMALARTPHLEAVSSHWLSAVTAYWLEAVGLAAYASRALHTLSGGEAQRVHLARALLQLSQSEARWTGAPTFVGETPVLFCDEPTSALDRKHQHAVLALLRRLVDQGLTVLLVLHDLNLAQRYADEVLLLRGGELHYAGPTAEGLQPARLEPVFGVRFAQASTAKGPQRWLVEEI